MSSHAHRQQEKGKKWDDHIDSREDQYERGHGHHIEHVLVLVYRRVMESIMSSFGTQLVPSR